MSTITDMNPEALLRLVYVSRRLEEVSDAEVVDGIALASLRRNRANDVTGCLWFGPTHFFQVLEGRADRVSSTYERIFRDPRHTDIQLLDRSHIEARSFERFAMRVVSGDESEAIGELIARHGALPDIEYRRERPTPWTLLEAAVKSLMSWRDSCATARIGRRAPGLPGPSPLQ